MSDLVVSNSPFTGDPSNLTDDERTEPERNEK